MPAINYSPRELDIFHKISIAAQQMGADAYVIGGFVRDKLLQRSTKDIDVVTTSDGILLAHSFAKQFKIRPNVSFFKNYGTAQVKMGNMEIEFVGARKESYNPDSRNPEVEEGTLEDDQKRRDFTINALAIDVSKLEEGTIIDPFDGLKDLEEGLLRTPLSPEQTYSDDPLRMMRAVRFAAQLNFSIVSESMEAITQMAHRIDIVSKERVADELHKIMMTDRPSNGLRLMEKTGLLERLIPQLTDLKGSETLDNIGHKDNFQHTLKVVDNISQNTNNLWLRYAALLHDIGKTKAKRYEAGKGWTFHNHEVISGKLVKQIFYDLKLPVNDKLPYVRKIVELHHRPISLTKDSITDSAIRRLLFDAGDDIDDLMTMCEADITSKDDKKRARYLSNFRLVRERLKTVEEKDKIRNWQPPISGEEIMEAFHLPPSKEVGLIKDAIREAILDGDIPNEREAAWQYMLQKGKELLNKN